MRTHHSAFTLIEVLVALVILAIALLACVLTVQHVTRASLHVKSSITAHWVAMNVLAKAQLGLQPTNAGHVVMLHQDWDWQLHTTQKLYGYHRVQVRVFYNHHEVSILNGFVAT